jgi:hypothetical protein
LAKINGRGERKWLNLDNERCCPDARGAKRKELKKPEAWRSCREIREGEKSDDTGRNGHAAKCPTTDRERRDRFRMMRSFLSYTPFGTFPKTSCFDSNIDFYRITN